MTEQEPLSIRELRRRLRELFDATCHLRRDIPADNPYAGILTTWDLARYLGEKHAWLLFVRLEAAPPSCSFDCPSIDSCRKRPNCRKIEPYLQKRLSNFFRGWDGGHIVKARVGDGWAILETHRNPALAPLATAQRAKADPRPAIKLTIDRQTLGLKVGR